MYGVSSEAEAHEMLAINAVKRGRAAIPRLFQNLRVHARANDQRVIWLTDELISAIHQPRGVVGAGNSFLWRVRVSEPAKASVERVCSAARCGLQEAGRERKIGKKIYHRALLQ
jgi:hypothetical protein